MSSVTQAGTTAAAEPVDLSGPVGRLLHRRPLKNNTVMQSLNVEPVSGDVYVLQIMEGGLRLPDESAFLQARGSITCDLTADTRIASPPAGFGSPTAHIRATAPRNNSAGINACRFEISPAGSVSLYGPNAGNPLTWAQFDSVQTIWR
ncbi:hypothetical protein ACFY84_28135 [Streptomyces sp. NPDC012438]|uniref:hypothetical protein n=1 Tax=Streptomyces sp. NPDC012438 TaxID=3364833 RepID=UPI0036E63587